MHMTRAAAFTRVASAHYFVKYGPKMFGLVLSYRFPLGLGSMVCIPSPSSHTIILSMESHYHSHKCLRQSCDYISRTCNEYMNMVSVVTQF
jgi:hypothetical protein